MEEELPIALATLKAAGALALPRVATADAAAHGKVWSGKKSDGTLWTLTKNGQQSYACTC